MTDMLHLLIRPWHYSFMQSAFAAVIMISATCAILGCFVVLRRMAFIGDAMSHTVLPGVVIAYLYGFNLLVGALIASLCTAAGIGWLSRRDEVREDTAIGVLFTGMFALGIFLVARAKSFHDFAHMLVGYPIGVTHTDLMVMAAILLAVFGLVALFYKELELTSVDPAYAEVVGLRATWMRNLLLLLLALAVVTGIQAVGVILITGLLVTPAATASLLTRNLLQMITCAVVLAILAGVVGLYVSFYANAESGAAIVLTGTAFFSLAFVLRQIKSRRYRRISP